MAAAGGEYSKKCLLVPLPELSSTERAVLVGFGRRLGSEDNRACLTQSTSIPPTATLRRHCRRHTLAPCRATATAELEVEVLMRLTLRVALPEQWSERSNWSPQVLGFEPGLLPTHSLSAVSSLNEAKPFCPTAPGMQLLYNHSRLYPIDSNTWTR
jgi:hypothetical protein